MVIKGGRKAGNHLCIKFAHLWDLQTCSSYLILFFAMIIALFCFVYFDILQLITPSGAGSLLLNLSAIRSFSRSTSLTARPYPSPNVSPHRTNHSQSPKYHVHKPNQESPENFVQSTMPPPDNPMLDATNKNGPTTMNLDFNPFLNLSQSTDPFASSPNSAIPSLYSLESDTKPPQKLPSSASPYVDSSSHDTGPTSPSADNSSLNFPEMNGRTADNSKKEAEEKNEGGQYNVHEAEDVIYERPKKKKGECNFYEGKWVRDESYPLYKSEGCPFIDGGFRCQENGRPDEAYLKWRWQPSACNLPRFESENMLNMLRGRRLVFVGDSIGRNQWESLLCMLASGVTNKTRIYEVNGQPITKHKGFLIFKFESYNCTIEYYRSPFLVPQGRPPRNAPSEVRSTLRVDTMDWSSKHWRKADVIVFNTGHWWSYEKTIRGGCFFQVGDKVNMSMSATDGFVRAMQTWRRWVASNINPSERTRVFFRTYAPVHFSGGTWKTGGTCVKEIDPYEEGSKFKGEPWTNKMVVEQTRRVQAQLLDITHLSAFRKDAHSSIYNVGPDQPRPYNRQDCSHWCLPGLPDTWNELLYASLLQSAASTWLSPSL